MPSSVSPDLSQSTKLLAHPAALTNMVRRIAVEAGELILEFYDPAGLDDADIKGDGSPVTQADRAAEKLIIAALLELTPGVCVAGEEAVSNGEIPDLKPGGYFWLVDPLDGTKEFIAGRSDFTVNIALIKDGAPVLGVVYAPENEELYAGFEGGAAIRQTGEGGNEREIAVRPPPREGLSVVASRNHGNAGRLESFMEGFKVNKLVKRGSSLKICAIAAGKADLYPRLGPTSEWDTAAAHAVLRAAGGDITDFKGRTLTYGGGGESGFLNPEFVAFSDRTIMGFDEG